MVDVLKGGAEGLGMGKKVQCGIMSTEIGKKGKELSGPPKAAVGLINMIQEMRAGNSEINVARNEVNRIVRDKYAHVFDKGGNSREIMRYNFYLYQLDKTMKAQFVRMDNPEVELDLSGVNNFQPRNPSDPFNPLLVTPNLNIELSSFGETYEELMSLPNYPEFAEEFLDGAEKLFEAEAMPRRPRSIT